MKIVSKQFAKDQNIESFQLFDVLSDLFLLPYIQLKNFCWIKSMKFINHRYNELTSEVHEPFGGPDSGSRSAH